MYLKSEEAAVPRTVKINLEKGICRCFKKALCPPPKKKVCNQISAPKIYLNRAFKRNIFRFCAVFL